MKRSCSSDESEEIMVIKKPLGEDNHVAETQIKLRLKEDPISDIEEEDNERTSTILRKRLGKCEVCAAHEAKYSCPKCEVKTCSLNCVKIHKKELECDGIRDRTKFIPLKQMTEMDFMSDYYFLEECTRYVEDRKVDQIKKYTRYNRDLPMHLNRLRNAAKDRNITLKILLQNFATRNPSTSTILRKRLGKCEVCAAHEAKYSCPKCEVKTCSLNCVKIHKKELECDGIRDRTKFIPLKQMTEMDFMSDYYFLEECTRYVEDRKVDQIKKYTRYNRDLPMHLNRLRNAAKDRNITLKILLQNFARHKENTTFYDWKHKKIWWRIKWIFVNAGSLCYTDEKCLENEYLRDLLKKYVDKDAVENVPEKRKLEYYQSKGVQKIKVLLKSEGIKRCRDRYYILDVNKTLKENLSGKTLVEYPCIYISYEDDCSGFDVIDSDEDVDEEAKKYEAKLNDYRKELLQKVKTSKSDEENEEDLEVLKKLETQKRKKERQLKREEYEKQANNFLFTDDQLLEVLSSSTEDED